MPEEVEIETKELQETIEEMHEERIEREEEAKRNSWIRYIALSTAILAVIAAVGALQSGALVNEAMMNQLKASDTWAEYQAARQKDHMYTISANGLLDAGARLAAESGETKKKDRGDAKEGAGETPTAEHTSVAPAAVGEKPVKGAKSGHVAAKNTAHGEKPGAEQAKKERSWKALPRNKRLASYVAKAKEENEKQEALKEKAEGFEEKSEHEMHLHHSFAHAVALIQVAIALSAVAALTRIKTVWLFSMVAGAIGIFMFIQGFVAK